jgi:hypothetical protein
MKRLSTRIKEVEGRYTELARLRDQRAQIDVEISRLEVAQEARVEAVLLEAIRKLGIARLPIGEVLATLERLADIQSAPVPASESAEATSGDIEVFVRISRNAAPDKRCELSASGLHWNGRVGRWTGKINAESLEKLRRTFGERVEGTALAAPAEEAGPERVDAQDSNSSVLCADLDASATGQAAVAEPDKTEMPGSIQSAATASLRVPVHSLRGLPRVSSDRVG